MRPAPAFAMASRTTSAASVGTKVVILYNTSCPVGTNPFTCISPKRFANISLRPPCVISKFVCALYTTISFFIRRSIRVPWGLSKFNDFNPLKINGWWLIIIWACSAIAYSTTSGVISRVVIILNILRCFDPTISPTLSQDSA